MDNGDKNKMVGHRQWVFSYDLGKAAFGGAYNSKSPGISASVAMKVSGMGIFPSEILPFVAYPPPGYFPAQFVYNRFSFWAHDISSGNNLELSVKINDSPQNISEIYYLGRGMMFVLADYGEFSADLPYYKIVNKRIDVHITDNATKTDYDYTIYPIDCSDKPMRTPVPTIEGDDYDKLDIGEAPKQKRQKKVAIGAGVGVSLVVIVIIILVLFIVFRHGCSHNHDNDETNNNNNNDNNDDHSESGENHLEDA
ncbi:hypothetical protein TVAG_294690 [Trichomonas vaginalis G3]|uniref:Uncharacterized protein n=1 Tax=Trichomonas vaginalis (strain ATCC PRA-98 / G3) TaxID=412133 RepID=A2DL27_TRIV3|nr:hypothetical protein TVAGG3_0274020 [Trichomonas vaginalis G3]EAY18818.1 hypothetical protein TVAG_294690 [Trichomonas vaginalis G3]KAI5526076.1 hypothetical protein TVAGG3_0274020 [Trichomonas vaginalis G3]|eukprot:XP_001579804.1 hypothetical protein [Trichomonas vaginalis G3]